MLPQERGFFMSKQETSRKPLIIGIIAAVVILAVLLGLLLTQCAGGDTTESTPAQTIGYLGEAEDYDLYWNLDRAMYDGKSEAGMSSRMPESDGYFHVRFFIDGETVELKVADRKTVNAIEVNDLMGLEFDDNGIVVGVISLDDMPLQQVGWKFYVQSIGGNLMKLNSAKSMDGMELLLEMLDETGIYDMTGIEGEVGKRITPITTDRVIAIANLEGKLTHVYIYERSEFMHTFEAECRHCKQVVTWKMWNKLDTLPVTEGHYQLQNDIQLKKQQSMEEDAKICLDLNGYAVDGGDNARMYSLHNPGANLALMDTSEEQTGILRGHSTSTTQGGVVWVRYGAFYMYGGTLDGSDMTSVVSGTVVNVPKEAYFYMYGGTIIGGTSMYSYNAEKNTYGNGLGGTLTVAGKFVMNDGLITGGKAQSAITAWNKDGTPKTYQRGIGGNIYVSSGGVFEMRGGTISNGVAGHSGGNVYLDGTAEMIFDGGTITGGTVTGKGRNGGNVFVGGKATLEMNGGTISWGTSYNCAGNLYINGTVNMNGGYIGKGVLREFGTGKVRATDNRSNVFQVGGKMSMYGGIIEGGYTITDTSATDKNITTLVLGGFPTIVPDKTSQYEGLVLTNGGGGVKVIVATLMKGSKIGVNATTGIFTTPTAEANTAGFYSTIEGADILYVDGCIALGRMNCVCGSEEHFGKCDGTELLWAPINSNTIPNVTGNYFLAKDVTVTAQVAVAENADVKLDLNGKTVTGPNNKRAFTTFNEGAKLTVTDTSEGKTGIIKSRGSGDTQGNVVWVRYGSFDFYGGTLDGSGYIMHNSWTAGKDGVFGTKDDGLSARDGGTVGMGGGTTFNMYGGTIIGNTTSIMDLEKTVTTGEGDDAVKTVVTKTATAGCGASVAVPGKSVFNFYDGVIRDGVSGNTGGNVYINGGTMNMYGGTISGGKAGPIYDAEGEKVVTKGWGGNVDVNGAGEFNLYDGVITGGVAGGNGGNVRTSHSNSKLNMYGGVIEKGESVLDQGGNLFLTGTITLTGGIVRDGKAVNGGNIGVNSTKDVTLKGVTITGGVATNNGGNIRMSTTSTEGNLIIAEGTVISGGQAGKLGGNISVESNNANKTNPVAKIIITGGTIEGGRAGKFDENGKLAVKEVNSVKKSNKVETRTIKIDGESVEVDVVVTTTETRYSALVGSGSGGNINMGGSTILEMTGGKVLDGEAANGGNIYLSGTCNAKIQGVEISGGRSGYFNEDGTMHKWTYDVLVEERLKKADEYKEDEADEAKLELQKKAEAVYEVPAAKASKKSENASSGWGANLYVYSGTVELADTTITDGVSGGNGGGVYVRGKDCSLTMTSGEISGNRSAYDNGGNLWIGGGADVKVLGGTVKNGYAYNNGGNIHANASATVLLDKVTVSGGERRGNAQHQSANVNLLAGDVTIGSVNIEGYVTIAGEVKLTGKPVIKGGVQNLNLNGAMVDVTKLEGGEIGVTSSSQGIFSGKADAGKAAFFFSDNANKSVVYAAEYEALGLGKLSCLCGKEEHLLGCDKNTGRFWQAWTSTNSLPVDSGNYYLINDITIASQTIIRTEGDLIRDGGKIAIDLNGHTVQNKPGSKLRLYWLDAQDVDVIITDTVGGGTVKNDSAGYTQGGLVWIRGSESSLTLINGTFDVRDYYSSHNSGGSAVAVQGTDTSFTMYGGTIYAPGAENGTGNGGAILVDSGGTMYLHGGLIEGGLNSYRQFSKKSDNADGSTTYNVGGGTGGVLLVYGRLEMSGGTINGGCAAVAGAVSKVAADGKETISTVGGHGGNIYLTGTMIMTGGTISNGKSGVLVEDADGNLVFDYTQVENSASGKKGWGGNIEVTATGTLEIGGSARILDGRSGGNGGNIYLAGRDSDGNTSTITVSGGEISGGTSVYDNGGNLWTGGGSQITISGGSLLNGSANNNGGNFHANAGVTVSITGGEISGGSVRGNTSHVSANVNLQGSGSVVTIGSTEITGYVNVGAGNTVKLTGKPVIRGGTTNLALNGNDINVEELDVGSDKYQVGITDSTAGIFTGTAQKGEENYFISDDPSKVVGFMNGKLTLGEGNLGLGRYTCSCAKPGGTCVGTEGGCDGEIQFWTAWTSGDTLPTEHGYWYLTKAVKTSAQFNMEADAEIHIDLNGFTVTDTSNRTVSTAAANKSGNVKLWITDSSAAGTGTIKLQYTADKTTGEYPAYDGQGGILWISSNSEVYLIAGTLDARESANKKDVGGGAVHVSGGAKFTMYGGTIYGAAKAGVGAAVSVIDDSQFIMKGGTVYGGKATKGGAIHLKGKNALVTVEGGTITGGEAEEGGNIYIDMNGRVELLGGTVEKGKAICYDKTGANGGNIYVLGNLTINGGTVSDGKAGTLDVDGTTVLFTTAGWGGNICLGRTEVENKDKTKTVYAGSMELISGIVEKGNTKGNGGSIYLNTDTTMNMSGGTVKEGISHTDQGGNIFCSGNLTISGTAVIEDGIAKNGGNIGINTVGTVTISGGTISGGTAGTMNADGGTTISGSGGNIRLNSTMNNCTLTISGTAEIKDGKAKNGGNISINRVGVGKSAAVNVQGGTITGGTATSNGGSIYVGPQTQLNVSGGTISGGSAVEGGNIYVAKEQDSKDKTLYYYGRLNMSGGTVTGGMVGQTNGNGKGGNMYLAGPATISGGTVSNGVAGVAKTDSEAAKSGWAGNIEIASGADVTISGTISGGWANNNGGSIRVDGGSVLMEGGSITGGTTLDRGGNIFLQANQSMTITGGTISKGIAGRGGNIAGNAGMKLTLSNVTISEGTANKEGCGARFNIEVMGGTGSELTIGDNTSIDGGVEIDGATVLNMSGKVIIDGGVNCTSNLSLKTNTITLGQMKDGSSIGITRNSEGAFTNATTEAVAAYFFADNEEQGVGFVATLNGSTADNRLWLGHYDCLCAGAGEDGACVGAAGGCTESNLLWMPWTSTNTLPTASGNWYLTNTVTTGGQTSPAANMSINLDLNGKLIQTSANRGIWMRYAGSTLKITDSVGGGTLKNTAKHDQGGIFWISATNTQVHLLAGTMDASGFTNRGYNSVGGAAVVVANGTGKFVMYGGEISANKDATENIAAVGAAVAVSSKGGTFELHGGKIYGGKVQYQPWDDHGSTTRKHGLYGGMGGAVFITDGGVMNMDGGEIIGGTAIAANATDSVADPAVTGAGGGMGGAIYLAGTLNMEGGKISGGTTVSVTDGDGNVVGGKGDNIYVASTGTLNVSGGEIVGGVDASEAKAVQVSGTAKITGGATYNLNLGSKELTVGALSTGASIGITAQEGAFTNGGRTEADLACFTSDNAEQGISCYNGKLYLGQLKCICGATGDVHKNYNDNGVLVGCDGTKVAWTPWTSTVMPTTTGYYYLTGNVQVTSQASVAEDADVVLDLNGYKVTPAQADGNDVNYRIYSVHNSGAKLTITDTYTVPETTDPAYDANRTGGEIVGSRTRAAQGDSGVVVWARWANGFTEGTTFVLLGGKLTGPDQTNSKVGAVFSAGDNGKFYMLGGTITGGNTTANGGNVYIGSAAKMVMTGGTISNGSAANGGNVFIQSNATFEMTGGNITKGTTNLKNGVLDGNGGNVYINNDSTMTMGGTASITDGNAKNGGNICINNDAAMIMNAGSVTGGTGTNAQGMQVFGELTVNGGKIEDQIQIINWNKTSGASITLSGAAELEQIKLNKGTDKTDMKVEDIEMPTITINGTLAATVTENGAERALDPIQVITYKDQDAYISGTTVAANADRFTTAYEGRGVHFVEGENKLYVGKYGCLCGENCGGATPGCDGEKVIWTAWNSASDSAKMPSITGDYYLTESFTTVQTNPAAGAKIRLDLNGQTVTRNDYRLYALNAAAANGENIELFITDNSAAGNGTLKSTLKDTNGYTGQGTVIWACAGNDVTLLKGTLDASGMITTGRGAAVSADDAITVFKMYGGTVIGGTAVYGNAIGSLYGNVEIHGGSITGSTEVRGALTIDESAAEVTMGDVLVKSWGTTVGSLNLSGSPAITSIDLATGSAGLAMPAITIGTLSNTTPYPITVAGDGYFTTATVEANADKFSATSGKGVFFDETESKLFIGMEHCLCGGNGNTDTANGGTCVGATEGCDSVVHVWMPTASRPTTSGYWYLTEDLTVSAATTVKTDGLDINLDLNGYDVIIRTNNEGGRMYSMLDSGTAEISILFTNGYRGTDRTSAFIVDDSQHADQTEAPTGGDQGRIVWFGGSDKHVKVYNVDFDLSNVKVRNDKTQNGIVFSASSDKPDARADLMLYNCDFVGGNAKGNLIAAGAYTDVLLHDTTVTGHVGGDSTSGVLLNSTVSTLTFSGSTYVTGNTTSGGKATNVIVVDGAEITLAEGYTGTAGMTTGITGTVGKVVVEGAAYAQKQLFTADNGVLGYADGKLSLYAEGSHVTCVCGYKDGKHTTFTDASGKTVGCGGNDYVWNAVTAYTDLSTPGNWYLTESLDLDGKNQISFKAGETRLDLNGYTLSRSSARAMTTNGANGAVVTITDTYTVPANNTDTTRVGAGVVLDYADGTVYAGQGIGFWLNGSGTLNWFNANIDASRTVTSKSGGTLFYVEGGCTLNLFGGDFAAGTAQKASSTNPQGAGIRCLGTLNMFAGSIHGGIGNQWGGNVHIHGGTMNMYGGSIYGGSIYSNENFADKNTNHANANLTTQSAGSINLYGGTVDGRVNSVSNPTGTIRICNDAKVRAEQDTATSNNLTIVSGVTYVVSNLNENGLVYLTSTAASFTVTMEGTPMTLEQVNARLIAPGYTASISGSTITFTKNP